MVIQDIILCIKRHTHYIYFIVNEYTQNYEGLYTYYNVHSVGLLLIKI